MAQKEQFQELSDNVLDFVGGRDNVERFVHCVTRLRFDVRDESKVDTISIDKIDGVVGTTWRGNQLQIIIGQTVGDAYKAVVAKTGLGEASVVDDDVDDTQRPQRRFRFSDIIEAISGSIVPLIPVLVGAGMLKVVILLLTQLGWLDPTSSTAQVLTFAAAAGFYFLPILVGKTAAKRFGANEGLGMLMGAMLLYPSFAAAVSEGTPLDLFGIPVFAASYAYSVFPALLAVAVMAPVQRFFARISPKLIRSVTEPLLTLIVMIPLVFLVIGPAGAFLGQYLAEGMLWLYSVTGPLGVAVLAAAVPFLVITGMHGAFTPYLVQMFATVGKESIFIPAMVINNINQGVAAAVYALRSKDAATRSTAFSTALTAIVAGVSEPAMFGINLRYRWPLYAAMIGSFAGGLYVGFQQVGAYAFISSGGLFAIPGFIAPDGPWNVVHLVIGWVIGAAVTFVAGWLLSGRQLKKHANVPATAPVTTSDATSNL